MNTEAWNLVQDTLDELALAFNQVTQLGDELAQEQYKAETMLLMVREEELIQEAYLNQQA